MVKDKADNNSVRVINLSGYETPQVKEIYGKDWIAYGEDNDYFGSLISNYLGSPTNSRCINGIVDMIYGRGLDATDSNIRPEMYAKMKVLLKPKDMRRVSHDYKMLGQSAVQLVYDKSKRNIVKVLHFPMETLRAEKATNGKIEAYYYHPKWSEIRPSEKPKRIPTFKNGEKNETVELYIFKPYRSGFYYYSPVDYHGCIQYCSLEEEVSNYHINNIKNGLQPSLLINFNNGVPNEETQDAIERKIYDKFSGSSNAGKFILAFNESGETKADLEPIHLPDAHAQYQFLSDESREKIMLGHGIVSPILLGIKDNTGFGNNAEELRTASILMDNIVIRPFQQGLIDGFNEILAFNGVYLNLYFITLQPIEFTELDNISTKVKREEETGEKLSSVELDNFNDLEGDDILNQLEGVGEVITDEWELVYSKEVKDSSKDVKIEDLLNDKDGKNNLLSKAWNFISGKDAKPSKVSSQDNEEYKVRYAYMPVRKSANSRSFCRSMEGLTSRNVVFRKEDINTMSFRGVNRALGHNKKSYSLMKFKGGKNCHHFWELRVYKRTVGEGNRVGVSQATDSGLNQPKNPKETPIRPVDMANKGAYPKNK